MVEFYVNTNQMVEFIREQRKIQRISPETDTALLNLEQMIIRSRYNPCAFDYIFVGGCETCRWKNRTQKCSCCRRNRLIKDCYEKEDKA